MKRLNKKGFTMAELLIVVAIIAVLVAIAIPVFTTQLEKAKEATDLANLRAAYAECAASAISDESVGYFKEVTVKQATNGWVTSTSDITWTTVPDIDKTSNAKVWVKVLSDGTATIETTKPTASATLKEL